MNSVWVVMMVKDEIDILPSVLDHLLLEDIDGFYIADNNSTDGTRDLLSDYQKENKNFHVVDDPEIAYYQQQKMNKWIRSAVDLGADLIVPADADEIWYSKNPGETLGSCLRAMTSDVAVAYVYDMVPDPGTSHVDNPVFDIKRKSINKELWPCVAFRYVDGCSIGQGNHTVSHPGISDDSLIEIRHFQYRSFEQYKKKLRNGKKAYDATDLPLDFGLHWRQLGAFSDEALLIEWDKFLLTETQYSPAPVKVKDRSSDAKETSQDSHRLS